ncbi:MAG: hypothetical protein KJN76_11485 [Eudoraea sp.]|nr:hypothetical protein [Eudoraea sp.]
MKPAEKLLLLIFTLAFLVSCSSDDSPTGSSDEDAIIGTWDLVELNISPDQDINEDGTANSNILNELSCVSGTLTFREDHTWSLAFNGVNITSITGGLFFISCASFTSTGSGTWQLQNNQLTLFQGFTTIFYTLNDNKLTNIIGEDLPQFSSEVYQKQ